MSAFAAVALADLSELRVRDGGSDLSLDSSSTLFESTSLCSTKAWDVRELAWAVCVTELWELELTEVAAI